MLLKESVDTENLHLNMVSLDEEEDKQPDWEFVKGGIRNSGITE